MQQCIILKPNGQIAENDSNFLKTTAMDLIKNGYSHILLDITHIKMIHSPGLSTLSYLHQQLVTIHGKLIIIGQNDYILYLLKTTNLDKVLSVCKNSEEAIKELLRNKIIPEQSFGKQCD